jgi:hypothetical protein
MSEYVETTNDIILEVVNLFRGKPVTQDALNEFCNRRHIEPMTLGTLDDHIYQVKHDDRMTTIYPLVLAEIAKIKYYPEYSSKADIDRKIKELDEIEDKIVEILIENELPYRLINTAIKEIDDITNKMLNNSKTRLSNLCVGVMLKVTEKHFGNREFTVKNAQDYYLVVKKEVAEAV